MQTALLPLVLGERAEERVDRRAARRCRRRGCWHAQHAVVDGQRRVRRDDVDVVRPTIGLPSRACSHAASVVMRREQLGHQRLVARVEVLDEHEGHPAVGGHVAEELLERLQAARGRAHADDGQGVDGVSPASPERPDGSRLRGLAEGMLFSKARTPPPVCPRGGPDGRRLFLYRIRPEPGGAQRARNAYRAVPGHMACTDESRCGARASSPCSPSWPRPRRPCLGLRPGGWPSTTRTRRESVDVVYWADGRYLPDALGQIDRVLRDHRTNEARSIDRNVLDLLFELRARLKTDRPFHVISGYRSPESNAYLRGLSRTSGVARLSQHMLGRAIDVRLPGLDIEAIRDAALAMRRGGVGFYPESDFVHVDVGRVRKW